MKTMLKFALVVAFALFFAPQIHAQGSDADYAQVERLLSEYENATQLYAASFAEEDLEAARAKKAEIIEVFNSQPDTRDKINMKKFRKIDQKLGGAIMASREATRQSMKSR